MANHSEAGRMRHGVVVGVAPRCAVEEIQYDAAAPAEAWRSGDSDTLEFEIIDWLNMTAIVRADFANCYWGYIRVCAEAEIEIE